MKDNWSLILEKYDSLIGRSYKDEDEVEYKFFGLVHGGDDYYYGMWNKEHGMRLLSCVGSIEGFGMEIIE